MTPARKYLAEVLGEYAIRPNLPIDQIGIDSLDFLDLMLKMEDLSGRECKPEDMAKFNTVGDIEAFFC